MNSHRLTCVLVAFAEATWWSVLVSRDAVHSGVGGFVSNEENSCADWLFSQYSAKTSLPKLPTETASGIQAKPPSGYVQMTPDVRLPVSLLAGLAAIALSLARKNAPSGVTSTRNP